MKKEIKEKKVVLKKSVCKQTPLWKNLRKYQALDYFNIPMTCYSMIIHCLISNIFNNYI